MTRKISSLLLLAIFLFFSGISIHAQITSHQVDSLVEVAMSKFNVAGASVAIVKDGKVVHSQGYGVKSMVTGEKVDNQTQFAIASNSKAFTTAALAMLVEEGKLHWTDKVADHLPEFKMYNDYVTQNFIILDLLTHRSGLGLGAGDLMIFPDGSDFTIHDIMTCFQYFEPQSAFRTKFDYDNLLYLVAGEIIARTSGMSWEEFIKTRIMNPLGMTHSSPSVAYMHDKSNLASPHNTVDGKLTALPTYQDMVNGAAGGIYSSADDLSKWMLVQLNHGKYGDSVDKQLFTEVGQNEMWKIQTSLDVSKNPRYNSHFSGYGLGWGLRDVQGKLLASHTGGLPGMLSITMLIPDINFGIVVLTNTEPGGAALFSSISQTVTDSYLGLDDFQWIEKNYKRMQQREEADTVTIQAWETVAKANSAVINAEDYTGIYQDDWFGKVEIWNKEGQLWFKSVRSPKLNGPMYFYNANTFAIKWEYRDMNADAFAIFCLDENGKAQSIKMKGISPNIDFSFDFQDLDLKRVEN